MSDIERRFAPLETEITGRKLGGYAAVFNQIADIGQYLEQLAPTAFRSALSAPDRDVRGLFNHDPNMILARTPNTLRLSTDSHGLQFELDLPDTTLGNDVRTMIDSGLISQCSFGFIADQQDWSERDGRRLRTHTSVGSLLDVSVVTYPAYTGTSVSVRSQHTLSNRTRLFLARAKHLI